MKSILLSVSPNLIIKDTTGDYDRPALARAVAYWLDKIEEITDPRPIGICFGNQTTSFQSVALLLATFKSGKDYFKVDRVDAIHADPELKLYFPGGVSKIFVTGPQDYDLNLLNGKITYTDDIRNITASLTYNNRDNLEILFRYGHFKHANTSGTTGNPKIATTRILFDAMSILTAIEQYVDPEDYCVFQHNMTHVGVHSTAILPAVFGAKVLHFSDANGWESAIPNATHSQVFYTTIDHLVMPKNNIRVVTTGGDFLKPALIDYLLDSGVETILDIYGLTEASPPLAIREIRSQEDAAKPFKWINKYYGCQIDEMGNIAIIRPDGELYQTSDIGTFDGENLVYKGRRTGDKIRFQNILVDAPSFKLLFDQGTQINSYFLDFSVKADFPTIYVMPADYQRALEYVKENEVVINVVEVPALPTNGGIKNTRLT